MDPQLSHGYALLYELVSKQSGLGRALIMGGLSDESKTLISEITAASKDAMARLEAFAEADPAIDLKERGLPDAEVGSRAAMESNATGRLLFAGKRFETRLLITQVDATEYGATLAAATAELERDPERKSWLEAFAKRYGKFRDRAENRLTAGPGAPK